MLRQNRAYDDQRYMEWCEQFDRLIYEFLDTAGNTESDLEDLFENAVQNAKDELDDED